MNSTSEIKRRITGTKTSAQLSRDPATLALGEYEGTLWATNRYWVTPARRVEPLLEQFNLDASGPGSFEVNGTIRRAGDRFRPGQFLPGRYMGKLGDFPEPATQALIGGHAAHVRLSDRAPWLAVYQTEDGTTMGLPADDLAWLSSALGLQSLVADGESFGEVRIMSKGHGGKPVALVADVTRTITPGSHGTGADGKQVWHAAETKDLGPRMVGLLMAVRLDAA